MSLPISLTTIDQEASRPAAPAQPEMPKPQTRQQLLSHVAEKIIANGTEDFTPPFHLHFTGEKIQGVINIIMGNVPSPIKRTLKDCFVIKTLDQLYMLELKLKVILGGGAFSKVYAASLYSTAGKVRAALKMPIIKSKHDIDLFHQKNLQE